MRLHGGIVSALQHASTWGSLSALFAAASSELWAPYQHMAVMAGILCGVLGIVLRSPDMDKDDLKDQCHADPDN